MQVVFKGTKETVVAVKGNTATFVKAGVVGQALIDFYNYFDVYRVKGGQALFVGKDGERMSKSEVRDILHRYPLSAELEMTQAGVQSAFGALNMDVIGLSRRKTLAEKFQSAIVLMEDDDVEDSRFFSFRQIQFTSFFALLDDEPVLVFDVPSIEKYIALEFYYTYFGAEPRKIGICPTCGTMFLRSRDDMTFCTRECFTEANNKRNKSNPYHVKYRSLQQRYNKMIHEKEDSPEYSLLCRCYEAWQPWAKAQYDEVNKIYQTIPGAEERLLRQTFPDSFDDEYIEPDIIAPGDFAARLKAKWEELKETA